MRVLEPKKFCARVEKARGRGAGGARIGGSRPPGFQVFRIKQVAEAEARARRLMTELREREFREGDRGMEGSEGAGKEESGGRQKAEAIRDGSEGEGQQAGGRRASISAVSVMGAPREKGRARGKLPRLFSSMYYSKPRTSHINLQRSCRQHPDCSAPFYKIPVQTKV